MANSATFNLGIKTSADLAGINEIKKNLEEVRRLATDMNFSPGFSEKELSGMVKAANDLERAMNKSFDKNLNTVNVSKFKQSLKESGTTVQELQKNLAMAGAEGQQAFLGMASQMMRVNTIVKQTNPLLGNFMKTVANTVRYQAINMALQKITGSVGEAYGYVKNLDKSLNNIQIVTEKSADSMQRFAKEANAAAQQLGAGTKQYTDASLIYYQQGLDDEEVKGRTDTTIKMANVLGESSSEVSNYMTAIWNNFDDGSKSLEYFGDVITSLGAHTASSAAEIAEGLGKFASVADTVGLSYEYATAALATVVAETRQSADTVGTSFKTLFARIQDLELGDEGAVDIGKYAQALDKVGIHVLDVNGNMKEMDAILDEMGSKWDSLTQAQQTALAQNVGGTRQYTQLIALMNNWDKVKENIDLARESTGTLQDKQEIYMQSTEAHLNKMQAAWENAFDSLLQADTINDLADAMAGLGNLSANFADSVGGLIPILTSLGATGMKVFSSQIAGGIATGITNLNTSITQAQTLKENIASIQQMFGSESWVQQDGSTMSAAMKETLHTMAGQYGEIAQYQEVMTEKDSEHFTNLLKQEEELGKLANQAEQLANDFNSVKSTIGFGMFSEGESITNIFDDSNSSAMEQFIRNQNDFSNITKQVIIDTREFSNRLSELDEDAQQNHFSQLDGELQKFMTNLEDGGGDLERFQRVLLETGAASGEVGGEIHLLDNTIRESRDNYINLINGLQGTIDENNALINSVCQVKRGFEQAKNSYKEFAQQKGLEYQINQLITLAGSISQLASSVQIISNLNDIWNNDDLSSGEKALQITTNLTSAFGLMMGGITGATKSIKGFRAAVLTAASAEALENAQKKIGRSLTEQETKAIIAQTVAEEGLSKALIKQIGLWIVAHGWLIAIAAVGATVALVTWEIVKAYNADADAAKKANEKAEELSKTYKDLSDKYNQLKNTISDYQSARDGIDKLTEGSLELRDAVTEANEKAIELMSTYGDILTTYSRGKGGLIVFDDKQLEEVQKQQERELSRSKVMAYQANIAANNASLKSDTTNFRRNTGDFNKDFGYLSDEQIGQLANAIADGVNREKIIDVGNATHQNLQEDAWVESVKKYTSELNGYSKTIEEYSSKNRLYSEEIVNIINQTSNILDGIDDTLQAEVVSIVADNVDIGNFSQSDIENEKENYIIRQSNGNGRDVSFLTADAANRFAEENGYNFEGRTVTGKYSYSYYDEVEKKTVTIKRTVEDIAEALARTSLELQSEEEVQNQLTEERQQALDYESKINSLIKDTPFNNDSIKKSLESFMKIDGNEFFDIGDLSYEDFSALRQINWKEVFGEEPGKAIEDSINYYQYDFSKGALRDNIGAIGTLSNLLSSDKKLTKKQLEEVSNEQGYLQEDYSHELVNFENESKYEQATKLNMMIDDSISKMDEYLDKTKQQSAEELVLVNEKIEKYEELNNKKVHYEKTGERNLSEEETKELEELELHIDDLESYRDTLEHVFTDEFTQETIFDSLINGIDTVINRADALKDITDNIGADWTIDPKGLEQIGQFMPEIVELQNAYTVLQDGSIQLTEIGKQALNEKLELERQSVEAEEASYRQQLKQQAEMKLAQAEYYRSQAEALQNHLDNNLKANETEKTMESNKNQYISKLKEITGQNDIDLNRVMQENSDKTAQTEVENQGDIYDGWVAVGTVAQKAGLAYLTKQFSDPGMRPSSGGGHAKGTSSLSFESISDIPNDIYNGSKEEIQAAIDFYNDQAQILEDQAGEYASKLLASESGIEQMKTSVNNAISGKGNGKSSKGGGGKDTKDKNIKIYEEEFDALHDINESIKELDDAMSDLDKRQEHLFGRELAQSLRQENKLLEQQKGNYEKLLSEQQKQLGKLAGNMNQIAEEATGATMRFDEESGAIQNYGEITLKMLEYYNNAIAQLNAGAMSKEAFSVVENNYNNFKKYLENYESGLENMRDTQNKIDDIHYKQLENNFKAWEAEIKVQLDLEDAKRQWNQFLREINKDFRLTYQDARQTVAGMREEADSLINSLQIQQGALHDIEGEIDTMMSGGEGSMFASVSEAQESLKSYMEDFKDSAEALYQLYQDAWDAYLNGIDEIGDQFQDIIDKFERIADTLDHESKMLELLYGEEGNYDMKDKIYEAQVYNTLIKMASYRDQVAFWKSEYENAVALNGEQSEDAHKMYQYWQDALQNLYKTEEQYLEQLRDQYYNTIDGIFYKFEQKLTKGLGFDWINEEWDLMKEKAEGYYDDIQRIYQLQSLENKWQNAVNDTKNVKLQKQLQGVMEQQLKELREKEDLSEADVELAEKRLALAQAQIALEDAQNNKNSMKLVRGADGNWSYQYVANTDDIIDKEQDVLDKQNDLYETVKNQWERLTEDITKSIQEGAQKIQEKVKEYNAAASDSEKAQLMAEADAIRQQYFGEGGIITKDIGDYDYFASALGMESLSSLNMFGELGNIEDFSEQQLASLQFLKDNGLTTWADFYNGIAQGYEGIKQKGNETTSAIIEGWNSAANEMLQTWVGEGETDENGNPIEGEEGEEGELSEEEQNKKGFSSYGSVQEAMLGMFDTITQAQDDFAVAVEVGTQAAGEDYTDLEGHIEECIETTKALEDATSEMVARACEELDIYQEMVEYLRQAWESVKDMVIEEGDTAIEYMKKQQEAVEQVTEAVMQLIEALKEAIALMAELEGGGAGSGSSSGGRSSEGKTPVRVVLTNDDGHGTSMSYNDFKKLPNPSYDKDNVRFIYKSGGYTGTWPVSGKTGMFTGNWNGSGYSGAEDGKLAFLHQKELVLNKEDTKNILDAVDLVRSLGNSIDKAVAGTVAEMAVEIAKSAVVGSTTTSNNNSVVIEKVEANFPNADDVSTIQEAIMSLPNIVSQYVNR